MPRRGIAPRPWPLLAFAGLALLAGCSKSGAVLMPNEPPTLTLTSGPIDTSATDPVSWSVPITWDARDADGTIDHVSYAVDPPAAAQVAAGAETAWVSTKESGVVARFRAATPDPATGGQTASDFHVFVARAWDNSGGASARVERAFYAYTVAPTARIEQPLAGAAEVLAVPRTLTLRFSGDDPDGIGSHAPAGFRVRLIGDQSRLFRALLTDPDSLRRDAVATGWRDWSTLGGDQSTFTLTDLPEDTEWIFAVAAVDAAGAVTPLFSFGQNLIRLFITESSGPRLRILGPGLDYTYPTGGMAADSSRWLSVQVPTSSPVSFSWVALAAPGRNVTGYRWVLDPDTLGSDTPRSDEPQDTRHWSAWSPGTLRSGSLGPWTPGQHMLYVEAEDDLGSRSLGIVRIRTFEVSFEKSLLVVDDTRFEVDRLATGGCLSPYLKPWPSAAELDTFLYAVGGVPWRCAVNPPEALSPPGLLAGYAADTVGTRRGLQDLSALVPLSLLAHYRGVLWLTDQDGALSAGTQAAPLTMMRWMSRAGNIRAIEDYSRLGGRVWIAGGGAALASLVETDVKANNTATNMVFSGGELTSFSPVVSLAHLRTQINAARTLPAVSRSAAALGGWSGHGPDGALAAPDYARLPAALALRSSATDPLPATRFPSQSNLFYNLSAGIEYALGSTVSEDFGGIAGPRVESALDTLMEVAGAVVQSPPAPVMLYYHGRDNGPVLFSGFDLWSWSRADAQALVDFVLQDVWGLARNAPAAAASGIAAPARATRTRAPETRTRRRP